MSTLSSLFGCLFGHEGMNEKKKVEYSIHGYCSGALAKFAAVLGALAFVLLVTSIISPPVSHAAFPGTNGKIAFTTSRDGNDEIYLMNPDGTGQINITNNPAYDSTPAWSPDGTKIAFVSTRDGNQEIYVMNANGSGQTNLTQNAASDSAPAWSPDGTQIVFQTNRGNADPNDFDVYVMNADGTNQTPLAASHPYREQQPTWSPCGDKIAYVHSTFYADHQLFTMNPDGTGQALLPPNILPINATAPNWSPDCQKIVFSGTIPGIQTQVYVINADGTGGLTQLTKLADYNGFSGTFSPDDSKIAFTTSRDGNYEVYAMNPDGTGQMNLTNNSASDSDPDWQPIADKYTLTVSNAGTGSGTVTSDPIGIDCGSDCSEDYAAGILVILTAIPDAGSTFTGWSGACTGIDPCEVTMDATKAVTATFDDTTPPQVTVTATPNILWPPNHKLVNVVINGSAIDNESGIASVVITVHDEYDVYNMTVPGFGSTIQLEAWREGTDKDGRVYTITVVATDNAGNQSTASTMVIVPHDMRK